MQEEDDVVNAKQKNSGFSKTVKDANLYN